MSWIHSIDRRFYPGVEANWDDALFRLEILRCLSPDSNILDLGAGAGIVSQMDFRGHAKNVCGVDVDRRVKENPYLDEAYVADASRLPFEDNVFEVVFADNLLEHLVDPEGAFLEVFRVLKEDGVFLVKTPQRFHYVPLIARMTPLWLHKAINRRRNRADADIFPTRYRANSVSAIRRLARSSGLRVEKIDRIEGRPEYLRWFWPFYLLGVFYERSVNSGRIFEVLRVLLVAKMRKSREYNDGGGRLSAE